MAITPEVRTPLAGGGSAIPRIPGISEGGLSSTINVTPMIDVMLVLLIIFMVVTPILTRYEATPPSAVTARPEPDDDVITLGIDRVGDFYLENQAVTDGQLTTRLLELYGRGDTGERILYLRADRGVSYARVLDAVEEARGAGVTTIAAITEDPEAEEAAGPLGR
jgi:biopolymer transport protein ExbD